jgi:hypothetical protein
MVRSGGGSIGADARHAGAARPRTTSAPRVRGAHRVVRAAVAAKVARDLAAEAAASGDRAPVTATSGDLPVFGLAGRARLTEAARSTGVDARS